MTLYLVNDKPFYEFDFPIDYDQFYQEAVAFMMSDVTTIPGANGRQSRVPEDHPDIVHPEEIDYTKEEVELFKTMDIRRQRLYKKIVSKTYHPWTIYNLNEMLPWPQRADRRNGFNADALALMPYFVETISTLPIFEHIGWARIYANEAFHFVHLHRDYHNGIDLVDEFIYLNIDDKGLYLRHYDEDTRVYPSAKMFYFDARNLHGTDLVPYFSFSIRIDGKFTNAFRNSLRYSRLQSTDPQGDAAMHELWKIRGIET